MTLETQNENLINQFNTDPLSKKLVLNLDNAIESAKNKILKEQLDLNQKQLWISLFP